MSQPGEKRLSKPKTVILLSGGLDSAANLALCLASGDDVVLALTADYGQRAARAEIRAARALCEVYGVRHEVVYLGFLGALGGSSLTETAQAVPTISREKLDELSVIRETAKAVWVPNRNGVLINAAAAFAERLGAQAVAVGFNREEATTFPDNSGDFMKALCAAFKYSTANGVKVVSRTVAMDKREIVAELRKLPKPFPFELVWSCYHSGEKPCGRCESCQRFDRAVRG